MLKAILKYLIAFVNRKPLIAGVLVAYTSYYLYKVRSLKNKIVYNENSTLLKVNQNEIAIQIFRL